MIAPASGHVGPHLALAAAPGGARGVSIAVRGPWQRLAHPIHTPARTSALPLGGAALGREAYGSEVRPRLQQERWEWFHDGRG